jgi:hypothetical protein
MAFLALLEASVFGQTLYTLDLTQREAAAAWQPTHDIARLTLTSTGLEIQASGTDPYLLGPSLDLPVEKNLWFRIRLRSLQAGNGQLFFASKGQGMTERNSIRFVVPGNDRWTDIRVPLPPLERGTVFRFDPPGTTSNVITVASMKFEERVITKPPAWSGALPITNQIAPQLVRSGPIELSHTRNQFGSFVVNLAGEQMAVGWSHPLVGYLQTGKARWFSLAERGSSVSKMSGSTLSVTTTCPDEDGAVWMIRQSFAPAHKPGGIDIKIEITVSQEREVLFLPLFVVFPGVGSFGESKNQAVFCGLEYLDKNEPSSSEADIIGPGAHRQIPDAVRITVPLMTVQQGERWLSLSWRRESSVAAVFDSPDRLFNSKGHLMGLIFPGSDGSNRSEDCLLPYAGERLGPGNALSARATLAGGRGKSVVPSLEDYVDRSGMPPLPNPGYDLKGYAELASAGWLDSRVHEGPKFRHAYPGSFSPTPAADAVVWMDWLARYTADPKLALRLRDAALESRRGIAPGALNNLGIGHIRPPVPALVYGQAEANVPAAREKARQLLSRFEPDGSIPFRKTASGLDYGRTHFAPDANGLTAQVVAALLESAAFCGEPELIAKGVQLLHALDKFDCTVPRGAQTWEVPLHTPDILAAANLVRAYTLGYELTGEAALLERARYWAWTGMPFIYLGNPAGQPIGPFATIAVFGATQWVAPDWMGLPVQWCGLVYADALNRLMKYDSDKIWKQVSQGITASGIQQTWPRGLDQERQGLLPDSFALRAQVRNDAAINPGTVQATVPLLYNLPPLYDFASFRRCGFLVHAPGRIVSNRTGKGKVVMEDGNSAVFIVDGWPSESYQVLLCGVRSRPNVKLNGRTSAVNYLPDQRIATFTASKSVEVSVAFDPL